MFVIDCDEMLEPCRLDDSCLAEDIYNVRIYDSDGTPKGRTTRVYKVYPDLRYAYRHCYLYRMDQHDPSDPKSGVVTVDMHNRPRPMLKDLDGKEVTIIHHRDKKPPERIAQGDEYKRIRAENKKRNPLL
jgi:hypothetical protein